MQSGTNARICFDSLPHDHDNQRQKLSFNPIPDDKF